MILPRDASRPLRPTKLDGVLWITLGLLATLVFGPMVLAAELADPLPHYASLPLADRFDFPVGDGEATGYHRAQKFGENLHLGEDWNRTAGGDKGEPVTAIATGRVTFAGPAAPVWGNVVRVVHHVRRHGRSAFVESVYAHLDTIDVTTGSQVARGEPLGTIGDADGRYGAHLHLEIRRQPDLPLGPGYSSRDRAWLDPTAFILDHR